MPEPTSGQVIALGRYTLYGEIAAGGMATVYFGRLNGPAGFSRVVAIKRMHPHFACDPEFVTMFLDEAQLAARVSHPNVVSTIDVVTESGEIFIVMEYVRGESLGALLRIARKRGERIPVPVAVSIMIGVLSGLHAAHEARDERGDLLHIVHRDVSPQNVLVGQDGTARLVDFGVAKAASRLQVTRGDQLKGKVSYMAPEQLDVGIKTIDRGADLFAAGSVLWELLAGRRLFQGEDAGRTIAQVLAAAVPPLGELRDDVPPQLEAVVRKALARDRSARFATADELAVALEHACPGVATARVVAAWVKALASDVLAQREAKLAEMESLLGQLEAGQRRPTPPPPTATPVPPPSASSSGSQPNPRHAVVSSVTPPPPSSIASSPPSPEASTASVSMAVERPSRRRNVVAASAAVAVVLGIGLGALLARRSAPERAGDVAAAGPGAPAESTRAFGAAEPPPERAPARTVDAPVPDAPAAPVRSAVTGEPPATAAPTAAHGTSPSATASARASTAATTAASSPKKPDAPPKAGGDYLPDRP